MKTMRIKPSCRLALLVMLSLAFFSCKKDNDINIPVLAEFPGSADVGKYFIKDDPNSVFKIPVGITTVSNLDRTITFDVSSPTGAAAGQQYSVGSTSVTIPAGTAVNSISLNGLYSGFASGRVDTLLFTITGGDVAVFDGAKTYRVELQKYCDVVFSDLEGDYNAIDNSNYGPYGVTIVPGSFVSTGTDKGSLQLENLWDYGVPTVVTVNLDWSDPSHFSTSIPNQAFVASDDVWIKSSASAGSFSSCNQSFTFRYTLYFKSDGSDYHADQVTVIIK